MGKKATKCSKCDSMKPKDGAAKNDSKKSMQGMMGMCEEMLGAMQKTTEMAAFATPELRLLFDGWLAGLESETLKVLRERGDMAVAPLAETLNISEDATTYLLARLKKQGKIDLRALLV